MGWTYLASWAKTLGLTTTNLTKYICDNLNYLKGLSGQVDMDNDLRIQNPANGKGMRFRRSGSALDIDFIGDGTQAFDVWFNWGLSAAALSNKLKITKDGVIVGSAKAKCSDGLGLAYTPVTLSAVHPTDTSGWQAVDLGYSFPANVVAIEVLMYNDSSTDYFMGVRPVGSSAGRLVLVHGKSGTMAFTTVNAQSQIEIYSWGSGAAEDAFYTVHGYFS